MPRLAMLLVVIVSVGCGAPATTAPAPAEKAPAATPVAFNVDGAPVVEFEAPDMHCSACAAKIVKALREQPGIVDVKANADTKVLAVAIEQSEFDAATVIATVEEAGFGEATQIEDNAS